MSVKGHWRRKRQVSDEEYNLRYAYLRGEIIMTEAEFNKRKEEIRERTGKP